MQYQESCKVLNSVCADLKRFSGFGFRSKLQTDVEFPLNNLDMSDFASECSDELSDRGKEVHSSNS